MNTMIRKNFADAAAAPKTVTMRRLPWDADSGIEVTLRPTLHGRDEWEVYDPAGIWLGTVSKYQGTIDRTYPGTRIRHEGKRRTLWTARTTRENSRSMFERVSRADAVRWLL